MSKSKIMILILFIVLILLVLFPIDKTSRDVYAEYNTSIIDMSNKDDYVNMSFVPESNYKGFGFKVATYQNIIKKGNLIITIYENNKIKKYKIKLSKLLDNEHIYIDYNLEKNKNYKIIIKKDVNIPIALYTTESKINNTKLQYNGKEMNNNLVMSFVTTKKSYSLVWYYLMTICIFGSIKVLNLRREDN